MAGQMPPYIAKVGLALFVAGCLSGIAAQFTGDLRFILGAAILTPIGGMSLANAYTSRVRDELLKRNGAERARKEGTDSSDAGEREADLKRRSRRGCSLLDLRGGREAGRGSKVKGRVRAVRQKRRRAKGDDRRVTSRSVYDTHTGGHAPRPPTVDALRDGNEPHCIGP
jgi:hypothetical protein